MHSHVRPLALHSLAPLSLALLSLAFAAPALAESVPPPDGRWRGSFGLGLTSTTGNNETFNAAVAADAVRRTDVDKMSAKLLSLYGEREENGVSELTVGVFRANARYDHDLSKLWYAFLGYALEKDKLADLKWRNSPSAGAGLHLRNTETFSFDVFAGYSYNHEELYDETTRSFHEALLGEETTSKFGAGASFTQRLSIYPNLTDSGEVRAAFDAELLAPVVGRWNLTLKYSLRYQSDPPAGVEKQDTVLYTGLQYKWGPE